MTVTIITFIGIIGTLLLTLLISWLYNYFSINRTFLSYEDLNVNLIKKYNLINYSVIDKKSIWLNFSIWNISIYLLEYSFLFFSFLILKQENNQSFIISLILIIVVNNLSLLINFLIAYFLYKKYYLNKQEYIQHNILEFKSKLLSYKLVDINLFNKTDVYNFRDKLYQKWLINALKKIKFKSEQQIIIKYYTVFLKYAH